MAIKVTFSQGQTEAKANTLYQWDYGQHLEIESPDLPTVFEVHFSCAGMNEAIVHSCSAVSGIGTVDIPNRCLEQSNHIIAWVYAIQGTSGSTIKKITIPIVPRIRPSRSNEIPQDISDRYTELITEVNEAVDKLTAGKIMVAYAAKATSADRALVADNASTAANAISANYAVSAGKATHDDKGDVIDTKYLSLKDGFSEYKPGIFLSNGSYQFKVNIDNVYFQAFLSVSGRDNTFADLGWAVKNGSVVHYRIGFHASSTMPIVGSSDGNSVSATIYYRRINEN